MESNRDGYQILMSNEGIEPLEVSSLLANLQDYPNMEF